MIEMMAVLGAISISRFTLIPTPHIRVSTHQAAKEAPRVAIKPSMA